MSIKPFARHCGSFLHERFLREIVFTISFLTDGTDNESAENNAESLVGDTSETKRAISSAIDLIVINHRSKTGADFYRKKR